MRTTADLTSVNDVGVAHLSVFTIYPVIKGISHWLLNRGLQHGPLTESSRFSQGSTDISSDKTITSHPNSSFFFSLLVEIFFLLPYVVPLETESVKASIEKDQGNDRSLSVRSSTTWNALFLRRHTSISPSLSLWTWYLSGYVRVVWMHSCPDVLACMH